MKKVEAEIRSFISEKEYKRLLSFFKKNAVFLGKYFQETHYLESKEDLRIQENRHFSKIWLKKGRMHDEAREEIEIKFCKKDFKKIETLFSILGFKTKIKWFRRRNEFKWKGISVCLDYTRGYGYIIELEKICNLKNEKEQLEKLKKAFSKLGIEMTSKSEFGKRFRRYERNWRKIV
jgi:predicted adenylyl cyclase CyaB